MSGEGTHPQGPAGPRPGGPPPPKAHTADWLWSST